MFGSLRWQAETTRFRARIQAARVPPKVERFDVHGIEALPAPVQRYFRAVLRDGQPIISMAEFAQEGKFLVNEAKGRWGTFQATQMVTVLPPAFDWDASIEWASAVKVRVRDAYAAESGMLHAAAFGLVTVADLRGTPEVAQGELMRYLAESAWYPTALLPGQGVSWEAMGDTAARESITDGAITVALEFRFDREGLITDVRSPGRHRVVDGVQTLAPWQGRFGGYAERSGMRVPLQAEVEWATPSGPLPYFRGRIAHIRYETAQ